MSTELPKKRLLSKLNETQVKVKAINLDGRDNVSLLPVFLQSSPSDLNILITSEQASLGGFRKIEPKPSGIDDENTDAEEETEKQKGKRKVETSVRFLESNPTRRGVRICITCKGRIGYRSKTCKHCVKLLAMSKDVSSKETLHNTLLQRKENTDTSVERNDGTEFNEQKENENINHRPLSADHNYIQMGYQKNENMIMPSSQMFCTGETVPNDDKMLPLNEPESQEDKVDDENEVEFHWGSATQARQVLEDTTIQEERDSPEQMDIKDEYIDNEKAFLILKQQKSVSSGLGPCCTTLDTCELTECVPLDDGDTISGVFVETTAANEINSGSPNQRGNKRKQAYPCKRKKKRKVHSGVQFVRIEPKPCLEEDEESKCFSINANPQPTRRSSGTADSFRFLPSNPTRRGIMLCPMCQKEVGCRSKTCKHCKVAINFNKSKALDNKNLLMVQLSSKTSQECMVFSLKKNITPSEDRCFVRQTTIKACTERNMDSNTCDFTWSCECSEHDGFSSTATCEHSKYLFRNPKIVQAKTANLTVQKIDCLPIDNLFKNKLKQLWEKNKKRELPLVQQVTLNTLVVLDIEKESPESNTEPALCVHVRFEKIKRHSFVQPHIFCSGKSCSYWSSHESQGDDSSPITCLHYCISLWAIASDSELPQYFKMFLEAPQVYLHSEEFESIVSS